MDALGTKAAASQGQTCLKPDPPTQNVWFFLMFTLARSQHIQTDSIANNPLENYIFYFHNFYN
jgi:hypothetical protein